MLQDIRQQFILLFTAIRSWLVIYVLLAIVLFSVGVAEYTVWGKTGYFFSFNSDPFVALLFARLVVDVAPAAVPIIVTSPLTAFVIQVKLALLAAFILTLPLFLYLIGSFLAPALYHSERMALRLVILASSTLFFFGAVFAYVFVVPVTLRVLYEFAAPIGVTALLSGEALLGLVFALVFVTGAAFMLPVMMVIMTAIGLVSAVTWVTYWRQVLVAILIISAIITPDGSGVSMVLLGLPTAVLYGCGVVISHMVARPATDRRATHV